MRFGQLITGSPGAGKSSYCKAVADALTEQGREVHVINLDPANNTTPYSCSVDVEQIASVNECQTTQGLGPNGALIFCIEQIEANVDWLIQQISSLPQYAYILIDCPGQVELFNHHDAFRNIVHSLTSSRAGANLRLACVHLVDSHLCTEANKYLSALVLSLSSMLHLELPHINVLSKIDNLQAYGELPFELEYFMEADNLELLSSTIDEDPSLSKYQKLTREICSVLEDFSLVNFTTLSIQDDASINSLAQLVDKASGYYPEEGNV